MHTQKSEKCILSLCSPEAGRMWFYLCAVCSYIASHVFRRALRLNYAYYVRYICPIVLEPTVSKVRVSKFIVSQTRVLELRWPRVLHLRC